MLRFNFKAPLSKGSTMFAHSLSVLNRFFSSEMTVPIAMPLSSIVARIGGEFHPAIKAYIKGQYRGELSCKEARSRYLPRLILIEKFVHRRFSGLIFDCQLLIEIRNGNPRAKVEAARISLSVDLHEDEAKKILNKYARQRRDLFLRGRAKLSLFKIGLIPCLLSEYLAELKRGNVHSDWLLDELITATTPEAVNSLSFDDFSLLLLDKQVTFGTFGSQLAPLFLERREFENSEQKLSLLVKMMEKGYSSDSLKKYLSNEDLDYLGRKSELSPKQKELLSARAPKIEITELRHLSQVSVCEVFSIVLSKVSDVRLDSKYYAGELTETFTTLSGLLASRGRSIISKLVDSIISDECSCSPWVLPFLFETLSRFSFTEVEKHLSLFLDILEDETKERLHRYIVPFLVSCGPEMIPMLLERLEDSDHASEHLLDALSQVLIGQVLSGRSYREDSIK